MLQALSSSRIHVGTSTPSGYVLTFQKESSDACKVEGNRDAQNLNNGTLVENAMKEVQKIRSKLVDFMKKRHDQQCQKKLLKKERSSLPK
ncbi:hypothetical protein KIN20_034335 [Parelaphostrongylus tenuis]|uniref:Uncharacterized protein n=1 Tax=Parelaphostrongylus tenuis TaxID=148309 RepID=A0AAD5R9G3_PARTN|nr:hypothetical protein KIN20_034335 [Parelaphostrongylus tenuis]